MKAILWMSFFGKTQRLFVQKLFPTAQTEAQELSLAPIHAARARTRARLYLNRRFG